MHILHLNTTAHAGGAARAMYRLHQGLQQQGHHSAIVARLNNGLADPNVHELATLTRPQHRPGDRLLTPAGRIADPAEVANLAVFLASDESPFLTGVSVNIDGGFTLL